MVYKYVCLGMVNPKKRGKVSWFHDECAINFNSVGAGVNAEKTNDTPPKDAKCIWCGKLLGINQTSGRGGAEVRA